MSSPDMHSLLQTADAKQWAEAFTTEVQQRPSIASDVGVMIGWFANAMMTSGDLLARDRSAIVVEFLNSLLEQDPNLRSLFESSVPVSQEIDLDPFYVRQCDSAKYATVTGVICAVCRLLGTEIVSIWNKEDSRHVFLGFSVAPIPEESFLVDVGTDPVLLGDEPIA